MMTTGQVKDQLPESTVVVVPSLRCGGAVAVALVYGGDVMDVVGDVLGVGLAEGGAKEGFTVAGVPGGTHQRTLLRRDFVAAPTSYWNVSAGTTAINSEWQVLDSE
jgi:hypothetical protein